LTCTAGPDKVSESVTVTLENDAPYTTATVSPTTVTYTDTPADYLSIGWKSNLSNCLINSNPVTLEGESGTYPLLPSGASDAEDTATYSPLAPGTYVITVTCTAGQVGLAQGTAGAPPITVNVLPPPPPTVTISSTPSTVTQDQYFTLTWSSTNAGGCMATGNGDAIGVIWGNSGAAPSGSLVEAAMFTGKATLGITCQSIDPNQGSASAQTTVTVTALPPPTAMLSVDPASVATGQPFTLTWSSSNATACSATGGGANGTPWSATLATSGSSTQTASVISAFTYTLTCSSAGTSVQSMAMLTVTAASSGSASVTGGGKSGGGGAVGTYELGLLTLLWGWRRCFVRHGSLA
jgi:hypothetical protein